MVFYTYLLFLTILQVNNYVKSNSETSKSRHHYFREDKISPIFKYHYSSLDSEVGMFFGDYAVRVQVQ